MEEEFKKRKSITQKIFRLAAEIGFVEAQLTMISTEKGGCRFPIQTGFHPRWNIGNKTSNGQGMLNDGVVSVENADSISPGSKGIIRIYPSAPAHWRNLTVGMEIPMHQADDIVGYAKILRAALNPIKKSKKMIPLLKRTETVLRKSKNYSQADFLIKLIKIFESHLPDFEKEICSVDMWGGSGSVCDVGWDRPDSKVGKPGKPTKEESEFGNCIIDLIDEMTRIGIYCPRANDIKITFQGWYRSAP